MKENIVQNNSVKKTIVYSLWDFIISPKWNTSKNVGAKM